MSVLSGSPQPMHAQNSILISEPLKFRGLEKPTSASTRKFLQFVFASRGQNPLTGCCKFECHHTARGISGGN